MHLNKDPKRRKESIMTALLWPDGQVVDRLDVLRYQRKPMMYSEAWRGTRWKGFEAHLALIFDGDDLRWLGRAIKGKRVSSVDYLITVGEVEDIESLTRNELERKLPGRHREVLSNSGILPPAGGAAVVAALRLLRPQYGDLINALSRPLRVDFPTGSRGELMSLERDAVGVLLDIARMERRVLRTWREPATDSSFLAGLPRSIATEDALISHDLERFHPWMQIPNSHVEWRVFSDGERRMFIMNANRTAVEHSLGVDLVYFNEHHGAFVLVQYKKMRNEGKAARKSLIYRPDDDLSKELGRMRKIDELTKSRQGDFRLYTPPCWLKLCEPSSRVNDPAELIRGMYLPRTHFELLLNSRLGPRGGKGLGFGNVKEYLSNTTFIDLVRTGLIGSRASGTAEVMRVIADSLASGHAVTFGVDETIR